MFDALSLLFCETHYLMISALALAGMRARDIRTKSGGTKIVSPRLSGQVADEPNSAGLCKDQTFS